LLGASEQHSWQQVAQFISSRLYRHVLFASDIRLAHSAAAASDEKADMQYKQL
jgi:hypothetical protein